MKSTYSNGALISVWVIADWIYLSERDSLLYYEQSQWKSYEMI